MQPEEIQVSVPPVSKSVASVVSGVEWWTWMQKQRPTVSADAEARQKYIFIVFYFYTALYLQNTICPGTRWAADCTINRFGQIIGFAKFKWKLPIYFTSFTQAAHAAKKT